MRSIRRGLWRVSLFLIDVAHMARYVLALGQQKKEVAGVRVILVDKKNQSVLLVQHWYAPGVWTLPGGGVDTNEKPEDAAIREAKEEVGIEVRSLEKEIGTYRGRMGKRDTVRVYATSDFDGPPALFPNFEIMSRKWFSLHDLPENTSPANRRRILGYLGGVKEERGDW